MAKYNPLKKVVFDRLQTSVGVKRRTASKALEENKKLYNKRTQYDDDDQDFQDFFKSYLRDGASTVKNAVKNNKLLSGEIAATGVLGNVAKAKADIGTKEKEDYERNIEAKQEEDTAKTEEVNKSTKRVTRSGEVYSPKGK